VTGNQSIQDRRVRHDNRSNILFTLGILLFALIAYQVRSVLLLVYVAALFSVVVTPLIAVVQKMKIGQWSPGPGTSAVILIILILTAASIFLDIAVPPILADMQDLRAHWPETMARLSARVKDVPMMENFEFSRLSAMTSTVIENVVKTVPDLAGGVFRVFYGIIIMMYFILDGERTFRWALSMFPQPQRNRLEATMHRAENRMRHWLIGQGALMCCMGLSCLIAFYFIKLKYFYAIAALAGLANMIPIIGPITAVAVASSVALFDSPQKLLFVLIFFGIYFQVETGFITPRIMRSTVDLPPLAVIIALSLGGTLGITLDGTMGGVMGALVAVPTAALCAVLIDEYLVKKEYLDDGPDSLED